MAAVSLGWMPSLEADAAIVSGSYQGTIDSDSGLGLIGQVMVLDFSYDDAVAPSSTASNGGSTYLGFLESMSVSIGGNSWHWDKAAGSSFLTLDDDNVKTFAIGVEDRLFASVDVFTGPNLTADSVTPSAYSLSLTLSDNVPFGAPDGLNVETMLPSVAPDPSLFTNDTGFGNAMTFSFFTGALEQPGGQFYSISTGGVTAVPEPSIAWRLVAVVGVLFGVRRRRSRRQ